VQQLPNDDHPPNGPVGAPRKAPRNGLARTERIVTIVGGIVTIVGALAALCLKVPDMLAHHASKPGSTQAAPAGPAASLPIGRTPSRSPAPSATIGTQVVDDHNSGAGGDGQNVVRPPTPAAKTSTTAKKASTVYKTFSLMVPPGIAYDLDNPANYGWDGNDAGYAGRDLYRTSKTSAGNQFQGVQVPVTSSSFNPVVRVATGSSPATCKSLPTTGGGTVPLADATNGVTFCVRTRAGRWAQVVITDIGSDATAQRSTPIGIRVTVLNG
jgi:hypothetical protein